MSQVLDPTKVVLVPDEQLYSFFKIPDNLPSIMRVFIPWADVNGCCFSPGDVFKVPGDPRSREGTPSQIPNVESIKQLVERGWLEVLSYPSVVLDDKSDNAASAVLVATASGDVEVDVTPVNAAEAEARTLPTPTVVATYDQDTSMIQLKWTATGGTFVETDRFAYKVTKPDGKSRTIQAGGNLDTNYRATGDGSYKFVVTLIAIDGRTVNSTEVTYTVVTDSSSSSFSSDSSSSSAP